MQTYSIALGGGGYIDDYGNYVEPTEPSLYMNFGYKSGVSYFAMNDKKDLQQFGELYPSYEIGSLLPTVVTGAVLWLVIAIANVLSVHRKVMAIWNMH